MNNSGEKTNGRPAVSVIVPVYNAENTLRECVDSILGQRFRNLELILIDDGSSDGSAGICDAYAEQDRRVRAFHQANTGPAGARNKGLSAAAGDYIGFVDSDDRIDPDMVGSLYHACLKYNADFAWCGTVCEREGKAAVLRGMTAGVLNGREAILAEMLKQGVNNLAVWDKLFRGDRIRAVRFSDLRVNEDVLALYRIVSGCEKAVQTGRPDYHYRIRETGLSQKGYSHEKAADFLCNLDTVRKMIVPDYPALLPLYLKNEAEISFALLHQYLQSGGKGNTEEYRRLKKLFNRHFGRLLRMKPYRVHAILLYSGTYGPLRRAFYGLKRRNGKVHEENKHR